MEMKYVNIELKGHIHHQNTTEMETYGNLKTWNRTNLFGERNVQQLLVHKNVQKWRDSFVFMDTRNILKYTHRIEMKIGQFISWVAWWLVYGLDMRGESRFEFLLW